MLLLETGMLGVFVALDLFLFYVFWEAMLIPMYLIIGIWGGHNRIYAAVKFILYTLAGSLLMLVAILALYFQHGAATGVYTFDLPVLARYVLPGGRTQDLLFLAFALAFAIKVPMFPFHTWLPDAHVEAPTAGSVILAGVLLKMGTYGFLRFCLPLFPDASLTLRAVDVRPRGHRDHLRGVGLHRAARHQEAGGLLEREPPGLRDARASSRSTAQGMVGGIIQMVNHGLSTGALFLMVGMIYERRHTRLIADFGGLWKVIPAFSVIFLVVCLSSVGLPGLNGFVGEFLILLGAFQVNRLAAVLATSGIIFAAVYLLWMYQRVCFGEVTHEANRRLTDLTLREWAVLAARAPLHLLDRRLPDHLHRDDRAERAGPDRPGAEQGAGDRRRPGDAVNPALVLPGAWTCGRSCRCWCWPPPRSWSSCSTCCRRGSARTTWASSARSAWCWR